MSLHTTFSSPDDSPGLLLWRVNNSWQAAIRAALKPFGLTHVQFVLLTALSWLRAEQPSTTQQQLAAFAHTDPMMTSQVLRALEERSLLSRQPHPSDGRAKILVLSVEAIELVNRAIVAVERCDAEFFGPDSAALSEVLGRIRVPKD